VITLFLTMLVGAGGNAGAQAAVTVIQGKHVADCTARLTTTTGIASGKITAQNKVETSCVCALTTSYFSRSQYPQWRYLMSESFLGLVMAVGMCVVGYLRVRLSGECVRASQYVAQLGPKVRRSK
jgi:hypothetical protein